MPVNIKGNIHYRTSEVYKRVGISRSTLMRWLKSGIIKEPYRDRRGWRLFTEDDLNSIRVETNRIRRQRDEQN